MSAPRRKPGRRPGLPTLPVRILWALRGAEWPLSTIDVAGRVDCRPDSASRILRRLARAGKVVDLRTDGVYAEWVAL